MKLEVVIREGRPSEEALVYQTWVRTFRSSLFAKAVARGLYESRQTDRIRTILSRGGKILVACAPEEPDVVLGWAVVEGDGEKPHVLHYVHVKEHLRRLGIATQLVQALVPRFRYTHFHQDAEGFIGTIRRKYPEAAGGIYDPYLTERAA